MTGKKLWNRWTCALSVAALSSGALLVDASAQTAANCTGGGVKLDLSCPELPDTSALGEWVDNTGVALSTQPANGQADASAYLDFDLWAWNSFIAMNWPAADPNLATKRGLPDKTASFKGAKNNATAVWETYKEKREVFLFDYVNGEPSTEIPQSWNSAPQYGPSNAQVPCCSSSPSKASTSCGGGGRDLGNASKLIFDTLDETAEVVSEALETRDVLCSGWVDPAINCKLIGANTCCTLNG